jgi:hypothetical protein
MSRSWFPCCGVLLSGVLLLSGVPRAGSQEPTEEERAAIGRLIAALKDADPLVRKRAAVGLARLGPKARAAIPALEAALSDRDAEVKTAAATALEAIDPVGGRKPKDPEEKPNPQPRVGPPSHVRKPIGRFVVGQGEASILLARQPKEADWQRVPLGEVHSTDTLLCLPGYAAQVDVAGGRLLLRGQLLEYARHPLNHLLLESVVTLHQPAEGVDIDLTLQRGRIFLTNDREKGTVTIRLRMLDEVWDLVTEPGTEIGVELLSNYVAGQNWNTEEPRREIYLAVLQGRCELRSDFKKFAMAAPPGNAVLGWDSTTGIVSGGPVFVNEQTAVKFREVWSRNPPDTEEVRRWRPALKELSGLMVRGKNPVVVLAEEARSDRPDHRLLAINALGALDQVPRLLDVLNDADVAHAADRDLAVYVLKRWLNRSLEDGKKLFDARNPDQGYLHDRKYTHKEAQLIFTLLHTFSEQDAQKAETCQFLVTCLNHEKQAVRELGYWQLLRLAPRDAKGQPKVPPFNSAWSEEQRRSAIDAFRKMIDAGELPPKR